MPGWDNCLALANFWDLPDISAEIALIKDNVNLKKLYNNAYFLKSI